MAINIILMKMNSIENPRNEPKSALSDGDWTWGTRLNILIVK